MHMPCAAGLIVFSARRPHVYRPLSAQTACILSSQRADCMYIVLSARRTHVYCPLSAQDAERMYIVLSARRLHVYRPLSAQNAERMYIVLSARRTQNACILSSQRADCMHIVLSARRTQNACILPLSAQNAERMYIVLSARRPHVYRPLSAQDAYILSSQRAACMCITLPHTAHIAHNTFVIKQQTLLPIAVYCHRAAGSMLLSARRQDARISPCHTSHTLPHATHFASLPGNE